MEKLIKQIEDGFPGWNWLVRKDEAEGYFANIYTPGSHINNHAYGCSPVEALKHSLEMLKEGYAQKRMPASAGI